MTGQHRETTVDGVRLEIAGYGAVAGPTLVFLHEGLGCVAMWRDFPEQLATSLGANALVYSRQGYGLSDPCALPRPLTYMHDEARVLSRLLTELKVEDAVLVGHSDGASIALISLATAHASARVRGAVLMAPHVFAEDVSIVRIREARRAFEEGTLRDKLASYHGSNTDCAFRGWNDAWLDPAFRAWNLETVLPDVRVPLLVIQGADDRYGTLAQLDAIERGVSGPFTRLVLPKCGHDPVRDAPATTRMAIEAFVATLPPPPRPPAPSAP